jgi:multiple sugar transport system ATP-binding protein
MSDATQHGLSLRNLQVAFGRHELLKGVDLEVGAGETVVLFGPSGVGKTVLLRAVAGLEPAARCTVLIEGRDVTQMGPDKRGIGMAFQNFALYPHMTARENIASPLVARNVAAAEAEKRVTDVATLLKITHVLGHTPRELSNGQKQRTALARALVGNPRVLLLDDPLRNVDAKLRYEMRLELPRLLRRAEAATIYVSQDYREAMALADRVAILQDGVVMQNAPPEQIYDHPETVAVAQLFGDPPINLLACRPTPRGGRVAASAAGLDFLLDASAQAAGRECLLGIRPEALSVEPSERRGAARAEVVAVTPLHERLVVLLRMAHGEELVASIIGGAPRTGVPVWITADPNHTLLFDAESGHRIHARPAVTEAAA